jgi:hypothetical protein
MPRRLPVVLVLLALATAWVSGCAAFKQTGESTKQLLGFVTPVVASVSPLGPYQQAVLKTGSREWAYIYPDSPACQYVLEPEAELAFANRGYFGSYGRGDQWCDSIGTLSLRAWRDRIARPNPLAPSGTANYHETWQDEQYILLRGQFPLLNLMGVPSYDLAVVVPNNEACHRAAQRGQATIVYNSAGATPYYLMSGNQRCVLAGFALPPDAAKAP